MAAAFFYDGKRKLSVRVSVTVKALLVLERTVGLYTIVGEIFLQAADAVLLIEGELVEISQGVFEAHTSLSGPNFDLVGVSSS